MHENVQIKHALNFSNRHQLLENLRIKQKLFVCESNVSIVSFRAWERFEKLTCFIRKFSCSWKSLKSKMLFWWPPFICSDANKKRSALKIIVYNEGFLLASDDKIEPKKVNSRFRFRLFSSHVLLWNAWIYFKYYSTTGITATWWRCCFFHKYFRVFHLMVWIKLLTLFILAMFKLEWMTLKMF